MNKSILYIIIGTILTIILLLGLWFWFFGRGATEVAGPTGLFGTSDNKPTTSTGTGGDTSNGQAPIGSNVSGTVNGDASGNVTYTTLNAGSGSGVTWLNGSGSGNPEQGGSGGAGGAGGAGAGASGSAGGSAGAGGAGAGGAGAGGGSASGSGVAFSPTSINDVDTTSVYGTPYITAQPTQIGLGSSLAVLAAGCLAKYTAERLIIGPATTGVTTVVTSAINFIIGLFGGQSTGYSPLNPTYTSDVNTQTNTATETISQCLARTIGRLAIQKITQSTVDWINSGFNGQPAFVQDYNKFFADTADQAAGQFIQGSGLAFLCSPFQLKVRIAIAQSYAHRSSNVGSCTLSSVVNNIDKFANGDFSQGGWQGLLAFTTTPTNNPFGAYLQAQVGLETAQGRAIQAGNTELTLGQGFLSVRDCSKYVSSVDSAVYNAGQPVSQQDCPIVTPGRAIVSSFDATTQSTLDSLGMADSIDDVLGALSNALITKVLYGGLANASSNSAPTEAQQQATTFFNTLQAYVQYAQQYGEVEQGSASDIQTSQAALVTLQNCWLSKGESSQADDAASQATDLEGDVGVYNNRITNANAIIAQLQQYQTQTLNATTPSQIQAIQSQFAATQASGTLIDSTAITSAQQDRTSLQARLAIINNDTSAQLQQCYAS